MFVALFGLLQKLNEAEIILDLRSLYSRANNDIARDI